MNPCRCRHTTADDVWRRTVDMRTQDYWRRSRRLLRGLALEKYYPNAPKNGEPSAEKVDYDDEETAGLLVQVDGQLQYSSDAQVLKEKGVYLCTSLHCAARTARTSAHLLHEQGSDPRNNAKEWEYRAVQQV